MRYLIAIATVTALTGIASAQAQSRVTPILRAEIAYTNTGYKETFAPKGYEVGPGLTAGVLIDKVHEVSISTGYTKFEGKKNVEVGISDFLAESKQIPVLLNYRFNYSLDKAAKYTVFAGPTVGFIRETYTSTVNDLGGGGNPAQYGTDSASKWKLAFGGTVGVKADLGKGWDVSASAQLLKVESNTYVTHSGTDTFAFDGATRPSFALSVGYSW